MQINNIMRVKGMMWVLLGGLATWTACNKGFDRTLTPGDYTDTTRAIVKNPKVLFVIMDGARGVSVRDANTPNISALTDHAVFSWNSITDTDIGDLTGWADLLTGVHKAKHSIENNSMDNNNLNNFPVFFKRIKERAPGIRVAAFSSSDALGNNLTAGADVNKTFADNDEAATTAAVTELAQDSAGLVMVQYNGVDASGAQYGYDLSVPQYRAAIFQTDDYIGKLLTALKARKSYASENWMIVVTSSHGGAWTIPPTEDDHTILSNPKINGFTIFSTPVYLPSFIDKPYTGNRYMGKGVHLYGKDASAVFASINDVNRNYDIRDGGGLTIEMKIKVQPGANGDYTYANTAVLSKRATLDDGDPGWAVVLNQKGWRLNIGQNAPGRTANMIVDGADISDGNWHDIAASFVYDTSAKTMHVRTFTDGKFNKDLDITGSGNLNNTAPLLLGYLPYAGSYPAPDVYVTELKVWTSAATDQNIADYACETSMSASHPLKKAIAGYWTGTDGQGAVLKDKSDNLSDFSLKGPYGWFNFNDLICPASPDNIAGLMPQPVDVSRQILDWLQVSADLRWNLDGRVWTTRYVSMNNN
ncbi:alkaline phosphatase family protein [Chitinophaga arvensicola]|uniref:Concanavalin A-like lectin/glucanases superfamily protein n=1 Tax=Chitinophaga arvensicola TaxID=29529 RepID=A0A1I0S9V7_9BACT|nr:alkaline phosphatase family protein [Chitinophaga arvensicola]SEW52979.1 Concanavalin A-like lectin/glucanases superfamily protein [Chitinophaga arvensicola]